MKQRILQAIRDNDKPTFLRLSADYPLDDDTLYAACSYNHHDLVRIIYLHESLYLRYNNLAFARAISKTSSEVRQTLLIRTHHMFMSDRNYAANLLLFALKLIDVPLLLMLIAAGLDPNGYYNGQPPLQIAIGLTSYSRPDMICIYLLLAAGADPYIDFGRRMHCKISDDIDEFTNGDRTRYNNATKFSYGGQTIFHHNAIQFVDILRSIIITEREQWNNAIVTEYQINYLLQSTYLSKLPRDLINYYILPYLGKQC